MPWAMRDAADQARPDLAKVALGGCVSFRVGGRIDAHHLPTNRRICAFPVPPPVGVRNVSELEVTTDR